MKKRIANKNTTSVPKILTGVDGLDQITLGGLPKERTTLLMGGPGSGKTILALQTLVNGAKQWGEPGIFVAFEENSRQVIKNAASFGWNLPELRRKNLFFLDARPGADDVRSGDFDLRGFLASLTAKAKAIGAKRIVFDSIDMLLSGLGDVNKERDELYRLNEWIHDSGLTAIITSKLDEGHESGAQRYGFLQFLTDCGIVLRHQTVERISQRELRVLKYRGSAFSGNAAPMIISATGIQVAHISATERAFVVSTERVSSGIDRLDTMLGGGYYRGTSVLVTGAPGAAKSTLSGTFLAACAQRGERGLYISFDETAEEHIRNLASVGIPLGKYVKSGLLKIYSARTEASNLEEHLVRIHQLIREHGARHVVFDPLSSLFRAGDNSSVQSASERLLYMTKAAGITTLCTSLLAGSDWKVEGTPLEVSAIADTWIHLSYAVQAGERNRALTIVKSRGTSHSNQVRELKLSDRGVTLMDVYSAGGDVLMGTLRWQRERAEVAERERVQFELERKKHEIKLAEAELATKLEMLQRELEMKRLELGRLAEQVQASAEDGTRFRAELLRLRSADHPGRAPADV